MTLGHRQAAPDALEFIELSCFVFNRIFGNRNLASCIFDDVECFIITIKSYYNVTTRLVDLVGLCWLKQNLVKNIVGKVLIAWNSYQVKYEAKNLQTQ